MLNVLQLEYPAYFRVAFKVGFPSGQREQTVNLSAKPSEVRILPPPPTLAESLVGDFGLTLGIDSNYMTSCMKLVSVFVGTV